MRSGHCSACLSRRVLNGRRVQGQPAAKRHRHRDPESGQPTKALARHKRLKGRLSSLLLQPSHIARLFFFPFPCYRVVCSSFYQLQRSGSLDHTSHERTDTDPQPQVSSPVQSAGVQSRQTAHHSSNSLNFSSTLIHTAPTRWRTRSPSPSSTSSRPVSAPMAALGANSCLQKCRCRGRCL